MTTLRMRQSLTEHWLGFFTKLTKHTQPNLDPQAQALLTRSFTRIANFHLQQRLHPEQGFTEQLYNGEAIFRGTSFYEIPDEWVPPMTP